MYQQLVPGVYAGVPVRTITDLEESNAAHEWLTLCAALGLDLQATAQGVVTEIRNLRAALVAQTAEVPA